MATQTDVIELGRKVKQTLNYASATNLLTNTNVAASNTVAALQAAVEAQTSPTSSLPAEAIQARFRVSFAIAAGATIGYLTDALLAPLTTVAGLLALFTDQTDELSAILMQG